MILAIVGSSQLPPECIETVQWLVARVIMADPQFGPGLEIVSGGATGVDSVAESEAYCFASYGVTFRKFKPAHNSWNGGNGLPGFKARNIQIAQYCDELVCIRHLDSATYGSGWTADYAEKLGTPVRRLYV